MSFPSNASIGNYDYDYYNDECSLGLCILGNLQEGKMIHDYKIWNGFEIHVIVENSLIYFYDKCESIEISHIKFMEFIKEPLSLEMGWLHGMERMYMPKMQHASMQLNLVTMASVFHACDKFKY